MEMYKANDNRYADMAYRRCGRSGLLLPVISLGLWHNFGSVDVFSNFIQIAYAAFDNGITHFDLANNYGPVYGSAEENCGRILKKGLGQYRDELVISTKAGYDMWPGPYGNWGSRKYLMASLDQSLKRMGLEYVDIFYSHRPDPQTPVEETMGALADIVRQGKALYVGISNYTAGQTEKALAVLKEHRVPCLIHQARYSMLDRRIEPDLLPLLKQEGVGMIAFSPLAQGMLTDKYLNGIPDNSRAAKSTGHLQREQVTEEKINKVLQEQMIIKNTLEINLKQANARKDSIMLEYQSFEQENSNMQSEISDISKNSTQLNEELTGTENKNSELEEQVVEKTKKLNSLKENIGEKSSILEEINIEIANYKQKHEFIVEKINKAKDVINSLTKELDNIKNNSEENNVEISARLEAIENLTKEANKARDLTEQLNKEIEEAITEKENQSKEHKEFFEKREQLSERISSLDKEIYRLSSQKEALEEKSENKEAYMWNEYEITYRTAAEMKNSDFTNKSEIRDNINSIRKQMKSLGDVNINAIEEFKEVNERYQFMKSQHEDLMEAKENLLKIIDELEVGMRKQFKEKFEEIKTEFDIVFKELFGGGKGTIELTDAEDILDAGINIISQPPGKKLQNMMQLSGGEKALTAISLLFAIQNLKPSPFCLLDEIEAALDGSNVVRFAEYLQKILSLL